MAPRRFNIEHLVTRHGVQGTANKLGVHVRTVMRWRNDGVDPSPLAAEKLKQMFDETEKEKPDPPTPTRHPMELPNTPTTME